MRQLDPSLDPQPDYPQPDWLVKKWPMTRLTRQLDWPEPTHPARFAMSTDDAEKVTSETHDTCTLEIAPA